jgi:uncharacterized membrane protein
MAHLSHAVLYFAIFLAGIIAGLLFGTALEQQQLSALDAQGWVTARQSIDAVFSRLLPWIWNITLLLLFASAYLTHGMHRALFVVSGVLLLAGIVVTLVIEVPINKQIAVWTPSTMPPDWTSLRDRWVRFHWLRTVAGIAAFVCALIPLVHW